ncbi:MAG TPA: tartrate dehydrogenase, partial [Ramlibacter sp.]|nr:tartrate dehydrogenase [Ramlibacter sp.]
MPEGLRVLDAVSRKFGIRFAFDHFEWCSRHYVRHGTMMPTDWKDQIGGH